MLYRPRACDYREDTAPQDLERTAGVRGGYEVDDVGGQGAGLVETRERSSANSEKR